VSSRLLDAVIQIPASAAPRGRSHAPLDLAVFGMKSPAKAKFQSRSVDPLKNAGRQLQATDDIRPHDHWLQRLCRCRSRCHHERQQTATVRNSTRTGRVLFTR